MNELSLYSKINDPLAAVDRIGEFLARSGMFGCEKIEQGRVLALTCMAEGLSPIEFRKKYHLINGELTQRADNMLAEFRTKLGGSHKVISRTAERAEIELVIGKESTRFKVAFEELQQEPFIYTKDGKTLKKNWATPRARMQMLWARVVSDAVRAVAPEIVAGVVTPEEAGEDVVTEDREIKLVSGQSAPPAPTERPHKTVVSQGTPGPVIDVPVTRSEPVVETKPSVQPELPAATPEPKPVPVQQAQAKADGNKLSIETQQAIIAVMEGLEDNAMRAFIKWGWLKDGQKIESLSVAQANAVIQRPQVFRDKIAAL